MSTKRVILVGATGMVGGCILRICLKRSDVDSVTVVGRRPTGITHPKMSEIIHNDFADYSDIVDAFRGQDLALYCIGVYSGTVPDDEFRRITVDYTVAFAETLHRNSPDAIFCFLSGQGADQTEKSRFAFARCKGIAEKALANIGFRRLRIFSPGYIYPVTPRKEPNVTYRLTRALYPVLRRLYPNIGVSSEELAKVMVRAGLDDNSPKGIRILENKDIRKWRRQAR
jgi:uncharacterized protein YbjT (DUF2867 family)